ncbi:MAG: hypothetical protein AB7G37_21655 [Solirubrobacteraceae bacterium]
MGAAVRLGGFLRNSAAIRPWGLAVAAGVASVGILVLIVTGAVGAAVSAAVGIAMVGVW